VRRASAGHSATGIIRGVQPVPIGLAIAALCLSTASPVNAQTTRLNTAGASDVAEGRRIFESQCAWCHGTAGAGGTGPDLRHPTLRHAANDDALVEIVRNGIPGTEMPSFAVALTERMAWQTAAYVRSLGRSAAQPIAGDPARGATVYEKTGCASCHVVTGNGGVVGPDLTAIGALRGATYLRQSLTEPAAAHPPGYLVARAVAKDGKEVRGTLVNEDVFWILLRDPSGAVHTLEKSDGLTVTREPEATLMPSYASRLTSGELDDLVAYLATLRGER
jgi:putative heme-binding domain-containing protein